MRIIISLLIVILPLAGFAQEASIRGRIVNNHGEALPYTTVMITENGKGTVSDKNGNFMLNNLSAGIYNLNIRGVGYKSLTRQIELTDAQPVNLELILKPDLINVEGVVVSASRYKINRKEASIIVDAIDAGLLETTQSVSLAEGLNFSPGLRLENNCQNCGFTQVRMNGLDGPYTQILINNRPVFSSLAGVYGLEQIPSAMIEQVEVVRGGGSALYGANAIAGTINIITKDPCSNSYQFSSQMGLLEGKTPDMLNSFNASLVSNNNKSGLFLFGLYRNRDPYNANPNDLWDADGDGVNETKDDFSEISLMDSKSFGINAFHRPTSNGKINLDFYSLNEERRGGNDFELAPHQTDITEQAKTSINGGGVSYETFTTDERQRFSAYSSAQQIRRDTYYGAEEDPNAYGETNEITFVGGAQYGISLEKFIFAKANLTMGAEYKHQDLSDHKLGEVKTLITDQSVNSAGIYLQNEWKYKRYKLLTGLRYDVHTKMDKPILNPRLNLLVDLSSEVQLRTNFSTGFRAPQVFSEDLHIEVSGARRVVTIVDPNLKPERSQSYSMALDYTGQIGTLDAYFLVEGFHTTLNNAFTSEITLNEETQEVNMIRTNSKGAKVSGLNFEYRMIPLEDLSLQLGYTIQRSRYQEEEVLWEPLSGNPDSTITTSKLLRSPDQYGYFAANWEFKHHWEYSLNGTFTGPMITPHLIDPDSEFTILEETPNFFDLSMRLGYHFDIGKRFKIKIYGGLKNIFNSFQDEFDAGINRDAGYMYGPMYPRTFIFGLKLGEF